MVTKNLKTNHLTNPVGIDGDRIHLSWICEGGIKQTAYRVVMVQEGTVVWDSKIIAADDCHADCPVRFGSRARVSWTVQLWDEKGQTIDPREHAFFETGLGQGDWQAKWVNPEICRLTTAEYDCSDAINAFARRNWEARQKQAGQEQKEGAPKEEYLVHQPASYLRKRFFVAYAGALDKAAYAGALDKAVGAGALDKAVDEGSLDNAVDAGALDKAVGAGSLDNAVGAGALDKIVGTDAPDASERADARLYITACGLYEARLNGQRVGDGVLMPGAWTADDHLGVQTLDVTGLLRTGENLLEITLGDGWYRSTSGVDGDRNLFGTELGVLFQLEVNGIPVCVSDEEMEASQSGPIRQNDMQQGEVYDARMEKIEGWHGVKTDERPGIRLCGMNSLPVKEQEVFMGRLFTAPNKELVLDFGQNLAGYIEIDITAHAGQKILLTCGEALDAEGNFTNENFQDRKRHKEGGTQQYLQLICKEGVNHFKPHFTIMGFRYALVETDMDPADVAGGRFTAHAVYSDMAVTGSFECSDPNVNQLVHNSIWSQKSNFCDVPTDCPTRERAAWTGDMGVFADTGLYLMDCYPVIEKWLGECRVNQYPDGRLANIAPPNGKGSPMTAMLCGSAGWGDAAILVPWTLYQRYGDQRILEENYEMMCKWYAFLLGRAGQTTPEQESGPYAAYTVLNGFDYGEWCEPDVPMMAALTNPRKSVGTAYLAYSGKLLSQIAAVLGKDADAADYMTISKKACAAYRAAFTEDGRICSDRQAEYVRAIRFGLLSEEEAREKAKILNQMIVSNGYHLNTGFLATPFLCEVLSDYGYVDTAYRLLLQEEAPGWLYAVKKGATSIWETWEGIDAAGQPHESLNHYSYGAVCGWLFRSVCGICVNGKAVRIAPVPDPSMTYAKAVYDSPLGRIESGWRYEGNRVRYQIRVPANVTALVELPDGRKEQVTCGTYIF